MSSFLVSKRGLSMLADGIYNSIKTGKIAGRNVKLLDMDEYFHNMDVNGIFYQLNYLNAYALNQRYDDVIEENMYSGEAFDVSYTIEEFLKMLDCFNYQCCEGDTVDSPLYHILNNELAVIIGGAYVLRETNKAYQEAPWG